MMNTRSGLDLIELAALQRSTEPYQVSFFICPRLKIALISKCQMLYFPEFLFYAHSVSIINDTLTVNFTVPDKSCRIY